MLNSIPPRSFEQAVQSVKGFWGTVTLMGGEPTLHPQFQKMATYMRRHLGHEATLGALRKPTDDFLQHVAATKYHRTYRGIWTSVSKSYMRHFEVIQDSFSTQALNDHTNESFHQPLLITRNDLQIADQHWVKLRDNCFVHNCWNAYAITPKGAFFCEIAATFDMLLDGPGGWPLEPGWWRRTEQDYGSQRDWCELCGAALPLPLRDANSGLDDISASWITRLEKLGSPKLSQKKYELFDTASYDITRHEAQTTGVMYLDSYEQRIGPIKKTLVPKHITVVSLAQNLPADTPFMAGRHVFTPLPAEEVYEWLEAHRGQDHWVLLLHNSYLPKITLEEVLTGMVFNPGNLYRQYDRTKTALAYEFFNLMALSLQEADFHKPLDGAFPARKIVDLGEGFDSGVLSFSLPLPPSLHDVIAPAGSVFCSNDAPADSTATQLDIGQAIFDMKQGILPEYSHQYAALSFGQSRYALYNLPLFEKTNALARGGVQISFSSRVLPNVQGYDCVLAVTAPVTAKATLSDGKALPLTADDASISIITHESLPFLMQLYASEPPDMRQAFAAFLGSRQLVRFPACVIKRSLVLTLLNQLVKADRLLAEHAAPHFFGIWCRVILHTYAISLENRNRRCLYALNQQQEHSASEEQVIIAVE